MKTPMIYQMTPCDCGSTTLVNALRFLFERDRMLPELVTEIYACTLDDYDEAGKRGCHGTSHQAIRHMASVFHRFGATGEYPIDAMIVRGTDVILHDDSIVIKALTAGAVGVARVWHGGDGHYVLMTGIENDDNDGRIRVFDPWLVPEPKEPEGVEIVDRPYEANRIVERQLFNTNAKNNYALKNSLNADYTDPDIGEIVLIWNTDTTKRETFEIVSTNTQQ